MIPLTSTSLEYQIPCSFPFSSMFSVDASKKSKKGIWKWNIKAPVDYGEAENLTVFSYFVAYIGGLLEWTRIPFTLDAAAGNTQFADGY